MGCSGSAITIAVIDGSLRRKSHNKGLTRFIQALAPQDCIIDYLRIDDLPLYNEDLEEKLDGYKKVRFPDSAQRIRDAVRAADAVIFSTPEYNGSISGALKNAYDWLSRDFTHFGGTEVTPIKGKKLGIVGASYVSDNSIKDVKKMVQYLKVPIFQETYYAKLGSNFDENGNLVSEQEKKRFTEWAKRFWKYSLPHLDKTFEKPSK